MGKALRMAGGLGVALTLIAAGAGGEQQAPASPATAGIYVVRPGDTLWSLSRQFLHSPFLWPTIWERNKFVVNPHRIYPGDPLLIPGLVPAPPEMITLPGAPTAVPPAAAPPPEPPLAPVASLPPAPGPAAPPGEPAPAPGLLVAPRAAIPIVTRGEYLCLGFIHERGSLGIGNILRPLRESLTIQPQDTVFLTLRAGATTQVGEILQVVREGTPVVHPRTGAVLGRRIGSLGLLQVTEIQDRSIRAKILYGCEDMTAGDTLLRYEEFPIPALGTAVPTGLTTEGMIVHSDLGRVSLGGLHIAYIDLGSQAGIVPGDIFTVHRETGLAADPRAGGIIRLTSTQRGELVVLRVTGRTATVRVLRSDLDLRVGDRIRLAAKMP